MITVAPRISLKLSGDLMGVPNSICKIFGEVWPTGTRDMGFYSKSQCHTHVCHTPRFTIEILQNFKITKIFAHALGDAISYPESLSPIQGAMADIWAATGLEA